MRNKIISSSFSSNFQWNFSSKTNYVFYVEKIFHLNDYFLFIFRITNNNIIMFLLIFRVKQSVHCTNNDFFSLLYSSIYIQSFYVVTIIKFFLQGFMRQNNSYLECLLLSSCCLKIFIDDALLIVIKLYLFQEMNSSTKRNLSKQRNYHFNSMLFLIKRDIAYK